MQAELVSRGPLSVLLDAEFLQFYHSGVWDPWFCDSSDLDHGVCVCVCVCVNLCMMSYSLSLYSCSPHWVWY